MKLPVYFPCIVGFGLGEWALPQERHFFLQELMPIENRGKIECGRLVSPLSACSHHELFSPISMFHVV